MTQRFVPSGAVEADVRLGNGEVVVEPAEAGTASADVRALDPSHEPSVQLAAGARVRFDGDRLTVHVSDQGRRFRRGQVRVTLTLPPSSSLVLKSGAADVRVSGGLVELDTRMGSGSVHADAVDGLVVKAGRVDVELNRAGAVTVVTGQGSLRAGQVGDATFKTGNGRVDLGRTEGRVVVKGGAVDLTVGEGCSGEVLFTAGSGSATVGVAAGTAVELDLMSGSGDVRCDLPLESSPPSGGAGLRLRLKSGSGDLRVAATSPV